MRRLKFANSAIPKVFMPKREQKRSREFTGISAPYEPPANPEVELRTDQLTVAESVAKILEYLQIQDPENAISI